MKVYADEINKWNARKGQSQGIPGEFHYGAAAMQDGTLSLSVEVNPKGGGTGLRKVDTWLMVMANCLDGLGGGRRIGDLRITLKGTNDQADLESFRRRISYLALNNGWKSIVTAPGGPLPLAPDWKTLLSPAPNEEIHDNWGQRKDSADKDGAIEKMLQTWLAGEDRKDSRRLAVLGEDFMYGQSTTVKVLREVPTGSFAGPVSKKNRLLPTYWIDLVTQNRRRELALIELKVSDSKLDVIAQALDYALFFRVHRKKLVEVLRKKLSPDLPERPTINCYIVNNRFHEHFDGVGKYYQPRESHEICHFHFKKVLLGATTDLGS